MPKRGEFSKGRWGRAARLARLGARISAQAASAAGRRLTGAQRERVEAQLHERAAESLRVALGQLKGLPMKAGQMLSYIDQAVPHAHRETYRKALAELQSMAPPLPWSTLSEVMRAELGADPDELFAELDRVPLAAASIGQVYRARLHDGRQVVVKVQYPGIAEAIDGDLSNLTLAKSVLTRLLPFQVDVDQTFADVAARMREECDYVQERKNQAAFAVAWDGHPRVWIPRTIRELCRERVLVSEFVPGRSWSELLAHASSAERTQVAETLFEFAFRSLYVHGMFNGDPHPGNFLFPEDGRVACLDFGCTQRFAPETLQAISLTRRTIMDGVRGPRLRSVVRDAFDLPAAYLEGELGDAAEDYLVASFAPVCSERFRFDAGYMERLQELATRAAWIGARGLLRHGVSEAKAPGLVFLGRINMGLFSLLVELGAEGPWREHMLSIDADAEGSLPAEQPVG